MAYLVFLFMPLWFCYLILFFTVDKYEGLVRYALSLFFCVVESFGFLVLWCCCWCAWSWCCGSGFHFHDSCSILHDGNWLFHFVWWTTDYKTLVYAFCFLWMNCLYFGEGSICWECTLQGRGCWLGFVWLTLLLKSICWSYVIDSSGLVYVPDCHCGFISCLFRRCS